MILTGRKGSTSRRQHGSQLEHVASLLSVKAHVPGLQDSHTASPDNDIGDGRKRQSNRYKRQAKKRKFQADMEQLENFRTGGVKASRQHRGAKIMKYLWPQQLSPKLRENAFSNF